ncbi:MAG: hypothetical protein R3255_01135 [Candidatus Lokiarchaeia archaeon]|nr:hypothetical protein [Candidatus Lokiarchaeia archaeon]
MEAANIDENDTDDFDTKRKKNHVYLIICIILMIVLMLPSTLAFFAIF